MSFTPSSTELTSVQILYTGPPFKVDATKIPADPDLREPWAVPIMRDHDWPTADEMFSLFDLAVQGGAIVIPDGLDAYLHTDTDCDGEGIYLLVRVGGSGGVDRYLTTGWQNVDDFAVDQRRSYQDNALNDPSDPAAVETIAAALGKFVRELNLALGMTFDPDHVDRFIPAPTEPVVAVRPASHRWTTAQAQAFGAQLLPFHRDDQVELTVTVEQIPLHDTETNPT